MIKRNLILLQRYGDQTCEAKHFLSLFYMGLYSDLYRSNGTGAERQALSYFGVPISYETLFSRIEQAAEAFLSYGVGPGDIVTLALPTTPESIVCLFALNKIGAIPSFIDVRFRSGKVAQLANNTHSKLLFIMSLNLRDIRCVAEKLEAQHIVVLSGRESLPKAVSFWASFGEWFNGRKRAFRHSRKFIRWDDFLAYASGRQDPLPDYQWDDAEPALIIQTSGTTGETKSVMLTTENCITSTTVTRSFLDSVDIQDSVLCLMPIFTFYGIITSIFLPLSGGMSITVFPFLKPGRFLKTLARTRPAHVFTVPSYWTVIQRCDGTSSDFSFLKNVVVAGEVVDPTFEKEINEFLRLHGAGCTLTKAYGMTETAGVVAYAHGAHPAQYAFGFSGTVAPPYEVSFQDGEICVLAGTRFRGYYNDPEATGRLIRQHDDGRFWIHTGDVGYTDGNGFLYVTGRKKRMIVRSDGSKLFPVEIERVICRHPYVSLCAVIPGMNPENGLKNLPIAYVVPSEKGRKVSENRLVSTLKKYCVLELPPYMRPAEIKFMRSFPMTSSGKIAYHLLDRD